ncbi:MAG: SMC-Scp complex subunit ScpB [Gammaproteobacteria bacterium]|nr:SMC-Scp complex subunit ScpB [Gammaproteobacteria bacterium]NNJ97266.1 SMC-Scp complex subunit ScpB [Gammaproteobacteria bacterium]
MEQQQLKNIIEAILMSAEKPLKVNQIEALFAGDVDIPSRNEIRQALQELGEEYRQRGFELKEVATGFRIQVGQDYAQWVGRLWEDKPMRYTRALLETLALIAYRQPITRGEIEEIRGVSVSSNIIKTLQEREWIKVLGHKDVPGKPALYGTSKEFLDYFNLKSLDELPTLAELKDLDQVHQELDLEIDNTTAQEDHLQDGATPPAEGIADDSQTESEASQLADAADGQQAETETEVHVEQGDENADTESVRTSADAEVNDSESESGQTDQDEEALAETADAEDFEEELAEPEPQSAVR